ncbi:hypothetical protein VNO77_25970 [Canavalia gladiata]|uniref:Uncharacterized protein n=1 Tax=Canavalia gladiata TaxID=3824 RepID=A0AAN9KUE4_CANGL
MGFNPRPWGMGEELDHLSYSLYASYLAVGIAEAMSHILLEGLRGGTMGLQTIVLILCPKSWQPSDQTSSSHEYKALLGVLRVCQAGWLHHWVMKRFDVVHESHSIKLVPIQFCLNALGHQFVVVTFAEYPLLSSLIAGIQYQIKRLSLSIDLKSVDRWKCFSRSLRLLSSPIRSCGLKNVPIRAPPQCDS